MKLGMSEYRNIGISAGLGALVLYALSAVGHSAPLISAIATVAAGLVALYFGYKKVQVGILLVLAELSIGSFGRLMSLDFGGYPVSLRQALFIGLLLGWLAGKASRGEAINWFPKTISGPLRLLWLSVAVSMLVGLGKLGSAAVVADANGYWLLLLAPIFFDALQASDWVKVAKLMSGTQAAVAATTAATLLCFAWLPESLALQVYTWVRDVRLGEITHVAGSYFRIFFQSHLYSLLAALGGIAAAVSGQWPKRWSTCIAAVAGLSVAASLSRSLWVGLAAGLLALLFALRKYRGWSGFKLAKLGGTVAAVFVFEIFLLQLITGNFPMSNLSKRFTLAEPAAASRAAQAGPLVSAIQEHSIWGSGFGRELTYQTADPRRAEESATVSTASFELGWLDSWLDIGLLGVLALAWWLRRLWKAGAALAGQSWVGLATMAATMAIAAVHLFTPYLNHPLGLGALLALSALQPRTDHLHA